MEFQEFPKMARLTREVVITEKIDGTNAQINIITEAEASTTWLHASFVVATNPAIGLVMLAGSRTRYITPASDNFGFAAWVAANHGDLWALGAGRHFGEWWGSGIQRGYGLAKGEKRFSLFNTSRWAERGQPLEAEKQEHAPACCRVVPVLYRGLFHEVKADHMLEKLRANGSFAAPGFMKPEGVVVYHTASGTFFKKTLDNDDQPKSRIASARAVAAVDPVGGIVTG